MPAAPPAQDLAAGRTAAARSCRHAGHDLWDSLRMLPVRFIEFQDGVARWKYDDEHTVKLGTFVLRESAQYISRDKKVMTADYLMRRKDSDWLCYYCFHCNVLLRAYELKSPSSLSDLSNVRKWPSGSVRETISRENNGDVVIAARLQSRVNKGLASFK
jgi:hypothetical protein